MTEPTESLREARLPAWTLLVSVSVLIGLVIGGASYRDSRQLIEQSQERARTALADGLKVALSDLIVINDYAGMESRLEQAMADPSLASAVVTDRAGKVLVHLRRERPEAEATLQFEPVRITPPATQPTGSRRSGSLSIRWSAIDAGVEPLGWLQLRIWSSSTDTVLALLARQYLVLGGLATVLVGTLLVSAQQTLRRQNRKRELLHLKEKAELEHRALSDPLTGVWNRRGVEQQLQRLLAQPLSAPQRQVAVCMIDLDDFKPVNDAYGHAVGDQVLVAVTRRLGGFLREDDILGRLGGDEFILIFRGCADPQISRKLATRIVIGLKAPFFFDGLQVRIGASIGIALNAADPSEPMESLLERADQAMYVAKHGGKGHLIIAEAHAPSPRDETSERPAVGHTADSAP